MIRRLSRNDAIWVKDLLAVPDEDARAYLVDGRNMQVVALGDEAKACIITYYELPADHPVLEGGKPKFATHVSRLLPLTSPFTEMRVLLAEALHQAVARWPQARLQPVWAMLDVDTAAVYKSEFPTARTLPVPGARGGRVYIYHRTLQQALAEAAPYRPGVALA